MCPPLLIPSLVRVFLIEWLPPVVGQDRAASSESWEIAETAIGCSLAIRRSGWHTGKRTKSRPLSPGLQSVWQLKQSLLIVDDMKVINVRSHFWAALLGDAVSWWGRKSFTSKLRQQHPGQLKAKSYFYVKKWNVDIIVNSINLI